MIEQGTPEWFAERCGKVTASRVADVVAKTKSGWGASRANYAAQLIAERLTGVVAESYQNEAMRWGTEKEPDAKAAYAFMTDAQITDTGFVPHPGIANSGASPDGLVGAEGLVEVKCPNTAGHLETLLGEPIASKYVLQMQWQMACTGRIWCDFVSFDPRLPERMRLFVRRVPRCADTIKMLETEISAFLSEIDGKVKSLGKLYPDLPVAA